MYVYNHIELKVNTHFKFQWELLDHNLNTNLSKFLDIFFQILYSSDFKKLIILDILILLICVESVWVYSIF